MDKNPLVRVRRTSLDFCPCPLPVPGSLEFPAPKPQILAPGLNLLADFLQKRSAEKRFRYKVNLQIRSGRLGDDIWGQNAEDLINIVLSMDI